jgi:Na+-driven multidrug efflux pump
VNRDTASEAVPAAGGLTAQPVTADPPLFGTTVRLSWSILLGMLAGLALQIWTIAFLGWQGPEALYVRSIYTPVGFLVLAVTEGLVVATQVHAGIAARTGEAARALRVAPTFLMLGGGVLALTAALFALLSGPVLTALGVPPADRSHVLTFIVAVAVSSAVGLAPLVGGAALRGVGRVGIAAVLGVAFSGLSAAAMVALNATTGLGVNSVPLGGLVATVIVGAITIRLLPRHGISLPADWRPSREALQQLWMLALPVAATFLLLSTVSFGYLRVLRAAGQLQVTGFSLGQMATMFFMVAATAAGSGAAIAVNIRQAADRRALNREGLLVLLRAVLPVYLVIGAAAFALRHPLTRLLTSNRAIADVAASYFVWMGPSLALFGGSLAMLTYLEQIGRARAAFTLNVLYFAVILGTAFSLPQPVTSSAMARLLAGGNVVGFVTLLLSAWYLVKRPSAIDRTDPASNG